MALDLNMHCIAPRALPSAASSAMGGGGGGGGGGPGGLASLGGSRDTLPEVGQRRTLIKGWVLAKVGAMTGYKKRFCRLSLEMEAAADCLILRKMLYLTSREDEPLEPRAAHPLWDVANIVEERKTSGKTKLMLKRPSTGGGDDDDQTTINLIAEEDA